MWNCGPFAAEPDQFLFLRNVDYNLKNNFDNSLWRLKNSQKKFKLVNGVQTHKFNKTLSTCLKLYQEAKN